MTAPPTGSGHRCLFCRCIIGSDQEPGVCVCTPCQGARRDYDPAHDHVFDRILEELFLTHPGVTIDPLRLLAVPRRFKWSVNTSVRRLRRRGMHITGVPYTGGYVYDPNVTTPRGRLRGRRGA
jgi:hypothetical protein